MRANNYSEKENQASGNQCQDMVSPHQKIAILTLVTLWTHYSRNPEEAQPLVLLYIHSLPIDSHVNKLISHTK